jgi:predicted MFS family arabinose efflux permease
LTSLQLGFTLGPALGGLLLAHSATLLWLVSAGVCVACAAASVFLGRALPIAARLAPISPHA